MRVKILFFLLAILALSSCTNELQAKSVTYIVEEKQPLVFNIEQDDPLAWLKETKSQRNELNTIRAIRDDEDDQEEFEFESTYSNVRRIIDNEFVIGYVKELDNPDFKEVDSDY